MIAGNHNNFHLVPNFKYLDLVTNQIEKFCLYLAGLDKEKETKKIPAKFEGHTLVVVSRVWWYAWDKWTPLFAFSSHSLRW